MVLVPLPNESAVTVIHALVPKLICPYTIPRVLLSDNGPEFANQILCNICQQFQIKQTFVTAHHPASNVFVERTNKKFLDVLCILRVIFMTLGKIGFHMLQHQLMAQ